MKDKNITVNNDIWGRVQQWKKWYGFHNANDTLKAILDEWEYHIPLELSAKKLRFKYKNEKGGAK